MPAAAPMNMMSDRTVLSRPSIDLVTCLLDFNLDMTGDKNILPRLASALAACAQLSSLGNVRLHECETVNFGLIVKMKMNME